GKVSDHHAIIPTEVRPSLDQLSQRELKIYTIIVQRFLETLMKPYEYENVVINFGIKDLIFTLKENIPKQLGFKALKEEELRQTSS
ncbi:DNA topoisomerase, partial [Staphylococcus intermedius]